MSKKKKTIILIIGIIFAVEVIVAAIFLGRDMVMKRNNQEAADRVIALIEQVDDEPITLEAENTLVVTKAEYDMLTKKQKELVSNYSKLEKALDDLQVEKDKKVAAEISTGIDAINENALTAEDVTVTKLMKQYDELTEAQKSYVNNYDLLVKYKQIVDEKIATKKRQEKALKLAENFRFFEGKWGDFGGHVDTYQGMVEEAIKRDVDYKGSFKGDVNDLYFEIYEFTKNGAGFNLGVSQYSFYGEEKTTGLEMVLFGEVIIKQDGTIYCTSEIFF